ncbi:MAG TPA: amidohydrolase [Sutterella sp.]|nr:amidohydrolase [Sutterella sp.]
MEFCLPSRVLPELAAWYPELAAIRRDIHRSPEIGFETQNTSARIAWLLRDWGISDIDTETVKGGVLAVVNGSRPGATIALRADIDALPMKDASLAEWSSEIDNRCHACGHDGHQTWLLATVRYLALKRDFPGRVVAIFQPAEELGKGALAVIESGIFKRYGIQEIYGGHSEPLLAKGTFGFRSGPLQAASDVFYVTLRGIGTHCGRPHLGIDPIPIGAQIVTAAQTLVSRRTNPIDTAVVSICSINAGSMDAPNIVPQTLTMSGCVRTFTPETRAMIQEKFTKIVQGIALANDCTAEVRYENIICAVNNDPSLAASVMGIAQELFGADRTVTVDPMMSSEDFAEYQRIVPGVIVRVGVRDKTHTAALHNAAFDFNDEVLPAAATLFVTIARERLRILSDRN